MLKPFARVAFNVVRRWRIHSVGRTASIVIYRLTSYPEEKRNKKKNGHGLGLKKSDERLFDEIGSFLYIFIKVHVLFIAPVNKFTNNDKHYYLGHVNLLDKKNMDFSDFFIIFIIKFTLLLM